MIGALQSVEALGDNDSGVRSRHCTCAACGARARRLAPFSCHRPNFQGRKQRGEHPMRKMRTVLASFAAFSLVLAACGGDDDDKASSSGSAEATGGGTAAPATTAAETSGTSATAGGSGTAGGGAPNDAQRGQVVLFYN